MKCVILSRDLRTIKKKERDLRTSAGARDGVGIILERLVDKTHKDA